MRIAAIILTLALSLLLAVSAGAQQEAPQAPGWTGEPPREVTAEYLVEDEVVRVTWSPVPGAGGYRVYRQDGESLDGSLLGSTGITRYRDARVARGAAYRYRVTAYRERDESPPSEPATISIPGVSEDVPAAPPVWVLAAARLDTTSAPVFRIHLLWRPANDNVNGFMIYRTLRETGERKFVGAVPARTTSYVETVEYNPGRVYAYAIKTIDRRFAESVFSEEREVMLVIRDPETDQPSRLDETQATLLAAALSTPDPDFRLLVASELGSAPPLPNVLHNLVKTLLDAEAPVRLAAVVSLGQIRSNQAVGPLAGVMASDADSSVRARAAWALGKIGGEAAFEKLVGALEDDRTTEREAIQKALSAMTGQQLGGDAEAWRRYWKERE